MARSSTRMRRHAFLPVFLARGIAVATRLLLRMLGRGGTSLPGKVLLWLNPQALRSLRRRLRGATVILVSATNGKTTTAAMMAAIMRSAGIDLVHNVTGANLRSGIATTLLNAPRRSRMVVLEVDEATLPLVAPYLSPDVIVLANLFRDQLDRYGELETLADRWRIMLDECGPAPVRVVYNADDPLIAQLVSQARPEIRALACPFGLNDPAVAAAALPHAADSKFCRECGHPLEYTHSWVGHLGDYACSGCDFARPELEVQARSVTLEGLGATSMIVTTGGDHERVPDRSAEAPMEVRIRIPGLYNAYNALAAMAASHVVELASTSIVEGLAAFSPAFGRFERIPIPGGGSLTLLLVKNPTGLNEVIRTLTMADVDLTASMFALNDGIADGRDTSWVWDADIEPLLDRCPALVVSGDRADEFALRCMYGGADSDALLVERDIEEALSMLLARARDFTSHGHAYALVTYTSMLALRAIVRERGWVNAYWEQQREQAVSPS